MSAKPEAPPKAQTEKQLRRRARILSIAREMIEEFGYEGVRVRALADRSAVSPKTLYDEFGSKDALLGKAIEERARTQFQAFESHTDKTGIDRLFDLVDIQAAAVLEMPNLARSVAPIYLSDPTAFNLEDLYWRFHRTAITEIADKGDLMETADSDFLIRLLNVELTANLIFWANDEIPSRHLSDFAHLKVCSIMGPVTLGGTKEAIEFHQRELYDRLRNWTYR